MSLDPHDPLHDEAPVLDAQALARLRQLDPSGSQGLLRRVLTAYRASLARLGSQVADGLAAADHASVRLGAHTLKSSSASVGALELSAICAALEQAARDERRDDVGALAARLQHEIGRVDLAVSRLITD